MSASSSRSSQPDTSARSRSRSDFAITPTVGSPLKCSEPSASIMLSTAASPVPLCSMASALGSQSAGWFHERAVFKTFQELARRFVDGEASARNRDLEDLERGSQSLCPDDVFLVVVR